MLHHPQLCCQRCLHIVRDVDIRLQRLCVRKRFIKFSINKALFNDAAMQHSVFEINFSYHSYEAATTYFLIIGHVNRKMQI